MANMDRFFKVKYRGTGFKRYPIGTVAYYGPDDKTPVKAIACIIKGDGEEASSVKKWMSSNVANSKRIQKEIGEFLIESKAKTIIITENTIGCVHEEGKDYKEGDDCPFCPFWKGKQ